MVNASDPVEAGLVASLARPGGNVTGLSQQLTREIRAKQLQLLKQALPKMSRVAVLHSAATTVGARTSSPERQRAVGHSLGGGGRLRVRELGTGLLTTSRCRNDGGQEPGMRSGRPSLISSARFTYSALHPVQVVLHGVRRCAAWLGRGPSGCWRSRRARPNAASRTIRGTDSAAAHDTA
jgi:hypothetical protein